MPPSQTGKPDLFHGRGHIRLAINKMMCLREIASMPPSQTCRSDLLHGRGHIRLAINKMMCLREIASMPPSQTRKPDLFHGRGHIHQTRSAPRHSRTVESEPLQRRGYRDTQTLCTFRSSHQSSLKSIKNSRSAKVLVACSTEVARGVVPALWRA